MAAEKVYTLDCENVAVHRMSFNARRDFTLELGDAAIALTEPKSDGWSFHGMLRDTTCKIRFIAPTLEGVRVKEESSGNITQLTITDRGYYSPDRPLYIRAQHDVGIIAIKHGDKQQDPIRLITDAAKHVSVVEHGLRPKPRAKLAVLLNGVRARQYRHHHGSIESKTLLFHRSIYQVVENPEAKGIMEHIVQRHQGDSVGHEARPGSHIPYKIYTVHKDQAPFLLWVVPSIYADRHELIHEESSAERLPLAYVDMRKVRSLVTDDAGYHGVTEGELVNNWIIKKEKFMYDPGFIPQLAESKGGFYPTDDSEHVGIPVIFQGCVLQVKGKAYHAAEISSEILKNSLS